MRVVLVLCLIALTAFVPKSAEANASADCRLTNLGEIVCSASGGSSSGGSSSEDSGDIVGVSRERPPIRYLMTTRDATVGTCYFWSRSPGGIDTWDPTVSDQVIIDTLFLYPACPSSPGEAVVRVDAEATAWDVFRSFVLAPPVPAVQPEGGGIAGLPVFVSAATPDPIGHVEALPDGRTMRVEAVVTAARVSWGDGAVETYDPGDLRAYPSGAATHTYIYRTCDPAYRASHPSAVTCHPELAAYPLGVTFTWAGRYDVGGGWVDLGVLDLSAALDYDVDEVVGVLED